jgi:hypothetical protein
MGKYFGDVGYKETIETEPGIWEEKIVPHKHYGDTIRNYVRNDSNTEYTTTVKSPQCNNSISIVADPYAFKNFHNIVYATYMGAKWIVTNVEVQYPRLILSLGGVYNGEDETDTSSDAG